MIDAHAGVLGTPVLGRGDTAGGEDGRRDHESPSMHVEVSALALREVGRRDERLELPLEQPRHVDAGTVAVLRPDDLDAHGQP